MTRTSLTRVLATALAVILVLALSTMATTTVAEAAGTFVLDHKGTETMVGPTGNECVARLPSMNSPFTYSSLVYQPSGPLTFSELTEISVDFNMQTGHIVGGSPRFSIRIDSDGDGVVSGGDKIIHVDFGDPAQGFTGYPVGWNNSGNLLTDGAARIELSQVGGSMYGTYTEALSLVGTKTVLSVYLVVDSGWYADQVVLADHFKVNRDTYDAVTCSPVSATPGAIPQEDLAGVRYRSFANTGGQEIFLGIPDLGLAGNRAGKDINWASGLNSVTFALDRGHDKLTTTVVNANGTYTLDYPSLSSQLVALGKTLTLNDLNVMQISVANRDTTGSVSFNSVLLDGNVVLGDFGGSGWNNWTVRNYTFNESLTVTGEIWLSGSFSNSQESVKVQIDLGVAGVCGNGILEPGEACDDGNTTNGDCCSSTCQFEPSTTVCRAAAGDCDVAETCTGTSANCPVDSIQPDGTPCVDGFACTTGDVCTSGVCGGATICQNGGACTAQDTCNCASGWTGATCTTPICASACQNGGTCTAPDTCSCTAGWTGPTCGTAEGSAASLTCGDGTLDPGEQCDLGASNGAPGACCRANCQFVVDGTTCNDGNSCTQTDTCVAGVCIGGSPLADGTPCNDLNPLTCPDQCTAGTCGGPVCPLHDTAVIAPRPITVSIPVGVSSVARNLIVIVRSGDLGAGIGKRDNTTTQFAASSADCPPGTIAGLPYFGVFSAGTSDTAWLPHGRYSLATVPLNISSAAFRSFNRKAPARCTLTLTTTTVWPPSSLDLTPENNSVTVELNVIDKNDTEQTTTHESVIASVAPLSVTLSKGTLSVTKKINVQVINADYKPAAEKVGDLITVSVDPGDCPAGLLGGVDFDKGTAGVQNFKMLKGGATGTGVLPLTINASAFDTLNAQSPTRCTAILSAVGPTAPDQDVTNNTTKLVIDVIDKNDF